MKKPALLLILLTIPILLFPYNFKVGDKLGIVTRGLDLFERLSFIVDRNGNITVPYAGEINVEGKTIFEVEVLLEEKLEKTLVLPEIVVYIIEKASLQITVISSAGAGKTLFLPDGSTVLDAIASSSIDVKKINLSHVKIMDHDGNIKKINVKKVLRGGEYRLNTNIILETGDTVYLPGKILQIDLDAVMKYVSLMTSLIVILKFLEVSI